MIGKTISHYRIVEKLGEGGMGVVYRAEDTKLDRPVALKFLPHYLTSDPTEKARFYLEARAASALIHPNTAVVFEIDEHEGQMFISMEYVEGRTLKETIEMEPLTIKRALDIAIQVCDGLAAAHEKGIVHRDIKSENIMVGEKGQPKITDFGLAKVKGAAKLTKAGSTVGTAAYMSPEQARGEEVDHRSDLFSFGVVLYEMLTGRLPFAGEHQAALLYSILNDEPAPVARFNEKVTQEIERIVAKALEKDRDDRYQHADEMLADLKRERKKLDYVKTGQVADASAVKTRAPNRRRWYAFGAAAALIVLVGASYLVVSRRPSRAVLNPDMTYRILPIPHTEVRSPGLSRDGNWAAFPAYDTNSKWDIYYMNTISGESRRVTADSGSGMSTADISPDGSRIVYDRFNESTYLMEIAVVSTIGGASKKIVDGGFYPQWRPDGERIGYVRGGDDRSESGKAEFWSVRPDGGDNRRELVDSTSSETSRFAWSPDGRSICWIIRHRSLEQRELFVYDLSTGKARQLTFDRKHIIDVSWAYNDKIIFASDRNGNFNLWMVPVSGGTVTQVTKGSGPDLALDVSKDGSKLVCCQEQEVSHLWIAGTDGSNPRQITFDDALLWRPAFSYDGKEIVSGLFHAGGLRKGASVASVNRSGGNRRELTSREEVIGNPIPSPDGRWIIYGGHPLDEPPDSMKVYLIDAGNPGTPRYVCKGCPIRWVDSETFVSFSDSSGSTLLNGIEGREAKRFFEDSTYAIPLQGGKYIGYSDWRSGRVGTWVSAAPGVRDPSLPSPRLLTTRSYGEFDKSGKFYYYVKRPGELRRISIPSGAEETVRAVFPGLSTGFSHSSFDISYDGNEIVYTDTRVNCKLVMIENPFK